MLATTYKAPIFLANNKLLDEKSGCYETPNPPYPYSRVGIGLSGFISRVARVVFFLTINIGTFVPSLLVLKT